MLVFLHPCTTKCIPANGHVMMCPQDFKGGGSAGGGSSTGFADFFAHMD